MRLKRWLKFKWQRITRGFSDEKLWNLDVTIAEFILPRLERLIEYQHGYPSEFTEAEWKEVLGRMIKAFKIISSDDFWDMDVEKKCAVENGLDFFREYYFALWD